MYFVVNNATIVYLIGFPAGIQSVVQSIDAVEETRTWIELQFEDMK